MKDGSDIQSMMHEMGVRARAAAAELAFAPATARRHALEAAADAVWARRADIIAANGEDMIFGRDKGLSLSLIHI